MKKKVTKREVGKGEVMMKIKQAVFRAYMALQVIEINKKESLDIYASEQY